jgi:Tol biopolymer transport system component
VPSRLNRCVLVTCALIAALAQAACDSKVIVDPGEGAPTVTIVSPLADATVSGVSFVVTVTATDPDGVDHVEFWRDDEPAVVDDTAPYGIRFVTLTLAAGSFEVSVKAVDALGNATTLSIPVTVAARTLTQLTTDVNDDRDPAWSPDGTRIAFQADRDGAQTDLWIMDADGGNQTRLTTNVNEDMHPAFSPDGNWIAWDSDREGTFDVWIMPLATGEADAENRTFGNNDDVEPAWSPGGTMLYFASSRGAGDFNIWSQDVGTGDDAQITALSGDERAPAIAAGGSLLAFTSAVNFTVPHVYTKTIGEVEVAPLTGDIGFTESDPAWIDDGALLFSRSGGLGGTVWIKAAMDPEGAAAQTTFGTGTVGDGGAAFSPDGDRVAFHSDRGGNLDIWVVE